ncbi:hypothetical protein [Parasitella parasitica]|uniref:Homeobox domain-containing protein n=1 Tax=Parasitella parasitica TaxID=35722 RepID=A0A0B7NGD8_9FUNG|nr:hypothetical protein [Parasitella parasitica]
MSPEMLMQPFEQSFNVVSSTAQQGFYGHQLVNMDDNSYLLGYAHPHHSYQYQQQQQQQHMDANGDFRPSFYNPFEIKHRRRTSRAQLKVLEKSFSENPKPNATVRRILAQKLDMTPRGVQIWFQNRRAKAKLLRRKSGQEEEGQEARDQDQSPKQPSCQQDVSPILFNQFFNNLKMWDNSNNARSLATAAAASCIFDNDSSDMMSFPIHPLAPVIESSSGSPSMSDEFGLESLEDWRRKSCPALGTTATQQHSFFQMDATTLANTNINRRMTAFEDADVKHHFVQPFPLMKPTHSECSTPRWNSNSFSSSSSSLSSNSPSNMDFLSMNYSPMSQQLTPMLSTGSPVPSIDGGYYDSCLDLLINCSPSNDK